MSRTKVGLEANALQEVWKADDDWTEIQTKGERKKRQNRLNQRTYRRRHTEKAKANRQAPFRVERFRISVVPQPEFVAKGGKKTSKPPPIGHPECSNSSRVLLKTPESSNHVRVSISTTSQSPTLEALLPYSDTVKSTPSAQSLPVEYSEDTHVALYETILGSIENEGVSASQMPLAEVDHHPTTSNPNSFPLSSDHLLHFIHQNVFCALMSNKSLLNINASLTKVELEIEIPASQNFCDGVTIIRSKPGEIIPHSLQPTNVQMTVAHSSWLNMFPHPAFRDNLIRYERDFDHGDLCNDLFGEAFASNSSTHGTSPATSSSSESSFNVPDPWNDLDDGMTYSRRGFIVWGESWETDSWEITPGFIKKWPWVLQGCQDLIASTNRWREKRYEEPVDYPIFAEPPTRQIREDFSFVRAAQCVEAC